MQTNSFLVVHRDLIAASAARYLLPTIGAIKLFAASGCLMSYGVETSSMYRGAAGVMLSMVSSGEPNLLIYRYKGRRSMSW